MFDRRGQFESLKDDRMTLCLEMLQCKNPVCWEEKADLYEGSLRAQKVRTAKHYNKGDNSMKSIVRHHIIVNHTTTQSVQILYSTHRVNVLPTSVNPLSDTMRDLTLPSQPRTTSYLPSCFKCPLQRSLTQRIFT